MVFTVTESVCGFFTLISSQERQLNSPRSRVGLFILAVQSMCEGMFMVLGLTAMA